MQDCLSDFLPRENLTYGIVSVYLCVGVCVCVCLCICVCVGMCVCVCARA